MVDTSIMDAPDKKEPGPLKKVAEAAGAVLKKAAPIFEELNILSHVRVRVTAREKRLRKMSQATHESIPRGTGKSWTTYPPELSLGDLESGMRGGSGWVTYQINLVYPKGHKKEGNAIKAPGAGNVAAIFVEETIDNGKPIRVNQTPIAGAPTVEEAIKAWDDYLALEEARRKR